jgi:hypothetical protein
MGLIKSISSEVINSNVVEDSVPLGSETASWGEYFHTSLWNALPQDTDSLLLNQ